ncbi:MAG: hypothetical protein JWP57_1073 [Spirosoma sp.]|nr:hypothetical protein [Spirosoma sp.]
MKLHAILQRHGKTATGFQVPEEVVTSLGTSKRPAVRVTINGFTYRSSIAVMNGEFMLGVSAENRQAAGIEAGQEVELEIELDTESREVVLPPDFVAALASNPSAKAFFEELSYSNQRRHVLSFEQAKTDETRQRRIAKSISMLKIG